MNGNSPHINGAKNTNLTANGRIQTVDPWFTKPEREIPKPIIDTALTEQEQTYLSACLDKTLQEHS